MLSKLKGLFSGAKQTETSKGSACASETAQENPVSKSSNNDKLLNEYGNQDLEHARELNLAFISNLIGVRALETNESKQQELELRAALDAEMTGMTERSIPKLSKSAMSLMHDLMSPEVDQNKIVKAVNEDPGLAGRVLSIANSPVYVAPGIKIKGIEHALSMLGHIRLRQVVMTSLMSNKFKIDSSYFETFGQSLWEHSTEVAINARDIADTKGGDAGLAYFAGLIHDIGKLIIFKKLVELHKKEQQQPHPQVFSNLLNDYSDVLTRRACEVWGLPEYWYQPVLEFQMASPGDLKSTESVALFLANSCAELHTLYSAGEITQFELVWRLQEAGSDIDEFMALYPDAVKEEQEEATAS
ncbi:MAG: HDOD domain-containing protein [Neptuniibacter sp.]